MIAGLSMAGQKANFYFAAIANACFHGSTAHIGGYIKQLLLVT